MWYKESKEGVMLEEGITEAGAFSAWSALASLFKLRLSNGTFLPILFDVWISKNT